VIEMINELVDEAGKPLWDWTPPAGRIAREPLAASGERSARCLSDQAEAEPLARIDELRNRVVAELVTNAASPADDRTVKNLFSDLEAKIVRTQILDGEPRIDGRDTRTIVDHDPHRRVAPGPWLPLFTRGETQALVVATLALHVTSRSSTRCRRVSRSLHASLQHAAYPPVKQDASEHRSGARSVMAGSRSVRWSQCCHARGIQLLVPGGLRGDGVERIQLHGIRVRRLSRDDGCACR